MDINFELYKMFYYVAKHLSFSEAANRLHVSQSAVSQSVKQLEKLLNTKLFFRSTKQVKLTQAGELLYKHAEQAFHVLKTGERSLDELHGLKKGELRIGASDTICKYYLLPFIKEYVNLYPQIKINITNRPSPVCVELLKKGLIDVSVINVPDSGKYTNLKISKLKELSDVFIAGQNYSFLADKTLTLKEISSHPLLLLEPHTTTRTFFDALLKKYGVSIRPEVELDSLDLLIELVKMGLGISFVSRDYIQKELAAGELFCLRVNADVPPRYIGVITHSHLPVPIAAQKFIELLK